MGKLHTEKQLEYWRALAVERINAYGFQDVLINAHARSFVNDRDIQMLHERIVKLEKELKSIKRG